MTILNIDFLLSKISLSILFFSSILNFRSSLIISRIPNVISSLLAYFILLTVCNYLNQDTSNNQYIDFLFLLNILVFIILASRGIVNPDLLLKGLYVFALSNFLVTIFFFLGIGLSDALEGRVALFNMNENYLGFNLVVSFLSLTSVIVENKLNISKHRYLLLLILPFLFYLIVKTGSRASFLSLLLGMLVFLLFNKSVKFYQKTLILGFTFIYSLLSFFIFLKDTFLVERLRDMLEGDTSNRDLIWESLWSYFDNHIFFGVGKTGFASIFGEASPHNVLLEVILYTGFVGLMIFLTFYYQIFRQAIMRFRYEKNSLPVILFIPITLLLFTGQLFDKKIVWVLFAYITGSASVYLGSNNIVK